jgi:hypothetical protein
MAYAILAARPFFVKCFRFRAASLGFSLPTAVGACERTTDFGPADPFFRGAGAERCDRGRLILDPPYPFGEGEARPARCLDFSPRLEVGFEVTGIRNLQLVLHDLARHLHHAIAEFATISLPRANPSA